jgi:hypothetical protein
MHFSTTIPPSPSLLMLVTNGPALLEHPVTEKAIAKNNIDTASFINIFLPGMLTDCLLTIDGCYKHGQLPLLLRAATYNLF